PGKTLVNPIKLIFQIGGTSKVCADDEIFVYGHRGNDPTTFGNLYQTLCRHDIRPPTSNILTLEAHPSCGRFEQAADGVERRTLAGAVCADQADDLAFAQLKCNPPQRLDSPIAGVEILYLKQCRHGRFPGMP